MSDEQLPTPFIDGHYNSLAQIVAENSITPTDRDLEIIEEMAAIGCTEQEICGVLKISPDNFKHNPAVKTAIVRGTERAKVSLRRLQWQTAQKNPIMQIFLGKQLLGQADKVEHKNDDADAVERARKTFADKLKNIINVTPTGKTARTTHRKGKRDRQISMGDVGEGCSTPSTR